MWEESVKGRYIVRPELVYTLSEHRVQFSNKSLVSVNEDLTRTRLYETETSLQSFIDDVDWSKVKRSKLVVARYWSLSVDDFLSKIEKKGWADSLWHRFPTMYEFVKLHTG